MNININIPLIGGTTTVGGLNDNHYIMTGSGNLSGNYQFLCSTPVNSNRIMTITWKANLNTTVFSTSIILLGHTITKEQASVNGVFTMYWNGVSWEMDYHPDFNQTQFIIPEKLTLNQQYRTISRIIDYSNPQTQPIINPFKKDELVKIYISEITPIDNTAAISLIHNMGGIMYWINGTNPLNGVSVVGDEILYASGTTPGNVGTLDFTGKDTDNYNLDWTIEIPAGNLATTGLIEVTFLFKLL